jgi:hypothetical protein
VFVNFRLMYLKVAAMDEGLSVKERICFVSDLSEIASTRLYLYVLDHLHWHELKHL